MTSDFKAGDLVQMTRYGIHRQHGGAFIKDENSKGVVVTGNLNRAGRIAVDWFADDPFPHKQRQMIAPKLLEPLGSPR